MRASPKYASKAMPKVHRLRPARRCGTIGRNGGTVIATAEPLATRVSGESPAPAKIAAPQPARLVSLDVFRGITIAAMILVNDPGSWSHLYWPLAHAEWNGSTPTDLIFPFFLFIAGVSMTLSFARRVQRGDTRAAMAQHVLRRSALIFAIGLFLNGFPHFDLRTIRIMGVLQRISLCYLAAGWLYIACRGRGRAVAANGPQERTQVAVIVLVTVLLLAGYWALMTFVPVPGYGAGHLGPQENLAAYLDRLLMDGHLWPESKTWDPEGLLSTLPAIATMLIGILVGHRLRRMLQQKEKRENSSHDGGLTALAQLALAGIFLLLAGRFLDRYFPINKNLWTSTYVLFTGGAAILLLALCYWLVELCGSKAWAAPFVVFGRNALLAFSLATLLSQMSVSFPFHDSDGALRTWHGWIYDTYFRPCASPKNASLAFALFFVVVVLALLWPLDRKKIFVRI